MNTRIAGFLLVCSLLPATVSPGEDVVVVKVVTYNVHGIWVPPPFRKRLKRFPEIARSLEPFDIAFLEELFTSRHAGDRFRRALLGPATHPTRFLPENDQGPIYSSGLAILSRLPPSGPNPVGMFLPYSKCKGRGPFHGSDCESKKGILSGRVEIQGRELHLYTTHLDAGGSQEDRSARIHQLGELRKLIEERSAGAPLILAGDFNIKLDRKEPKQDASALRALRDELGLRDLCCSASCDSADCSNWNLCGDGRIDYIFFRSGEGLDLEAHAAGWSENSRQGGRGSRLSDHPLLWGELEIRVTTPTKSPPTRRSRASLPPGR